MFGPGSVHVAFLRSPTGGRPKGRLGMRRARMLASAMALAVAVALVAAACGGNDNGGGSGGSGSGVALTGAGATFPQPVYALWFKDFQKVESGAKINYQAIGSG